MVSDCSGGGSMRFGRWVIWKLLMCGRGWSYCSKNSIYRGVLGEVINFDLNLSSLLTISWNLKIKKKPLILLSAAHSLWCIVWNEQQDWEEKCFLIAGRLHVHCPSLLTHSCWRLSEVISSFCSLKFLCTSHIVTKLCFCYVSADLF